MTSQQDKRLKKPGRPRATDITTALKAAARQRMASDGYANLSVDSLVSEVGTTRPTFYRRFPSIPHLVLEILCEASRPSPIVNTGSLRDDLLILQVEHVKMMSSQLICNCLPGILEEIRKNQLVHDLYRDQFVVPRRTHVGQVIQLGLDRGEINIPQLDLETVCDMLNGPVFSRLLLPIEAPLDDKFARQIVEGVCAYLGVA